MPAKIVSNSKKLDKELKKLGAQIRARRKELGVSSTEAAEAAEISRVTLYRIEKGEASATLGAYLSVILSLGLQIVLIDPNATPEQTKKKKLPQKIRISNYKQLKRIAWQVKDTETLTPEQALDLYERNWRHVDIRKMDEKEKNLLESLLQIFGRERLLV